MSTYRIAAVSYINTIPFLEGLETSARKDEFELILVPPSACADLYMRGEVDIALCPVGVLRDMPPYRIITDFGIGCDGPVRTVALVSGEELEDIRSVQFDEDSRTSNLLIQVLGRRYWNRKWRFFYDEDPDKWRSIPGGARVAIGDKVFGFEEEGVNLWDLGEAWKGFSGLPFLFAAWICRPDLPPYVVSELNACFRTGVSRIPDLDLPGSHLHYVKEFISYPVDRAKEKALEIFLQEVSEFQDSPVYS